MTTLINPNNSFDGMLFKKSSLWEELYPAGEAMINNPNKWIHFTDFESLEINPEKSHKDPYGIYFYSASWLLKNYAGFQYGMVKPHAYMADIKTRDVNGINLGRMTEYQAYDIADKNGWLMYYNKVRRYPEDYLSEGPMDKKLWKKPGGVFYAAADALVNHPDVFGDEKPSTPFDWDQILNGLQYVYDPGRGIIASGEDKQIIVLDPSIIRNVQYIDNTPQYGKVALKTMTKIMNILGGDLKTQGEKIIGHFVYESSPVEIESDLENYRLFVHSFQKGIKYSETISLDGYEWGLSIDSDVDTFVYRIRNFLEKNPPEKKGKVLYWNKQRLRELMSGLGILGCERRDSISDKGQYVMWGDGYGLFFKFITDLSDNLNINIEQKIGSSDKKYQYNKTFNKGTDLEIISSDFKENQKLWFNEYVKSNQNNENEGDVEDNVNKSI